MRTSSIMIILIVVILLIFAFIWLIRDETTDQKVEATSVVGCYAVRNSNDVYTLNIKSQTDTNFSGTLAFKNFEKDSSSGTFNGTYKDGILLGEYSFQSEGTNSIMEVIFKKSGDNFIRGYGDVTAEGTKFTDIDNIIYDESSLLAVFKKETCS